MIWHEPEDWDRKNRKVCSEMVWWFVYFQNLEIIQIKEGHSWPCSLLQPACWTRLLPVELSYNHIKNCIEDCPVLPLAEIMAWPSPEKWGQICTTSFKNQTPTALTGIFLAFFSGKSALRQESPKVITDGQVLCNFYYRQSASAVLCKDQGLISYFHPIFVSLPSPRS